MGIISQDRRRFLTNVEELLSQHARMTHVGVSQCAQYPVNKTYIDRTPVRYTYTYMKTAQTMCDLSCTWVGIVACTLLSSHRYCTRVNRRHCQDETLSILYVWALDPNH